MDNIVFKDQGYSVYMNTIIYENEQVQVLTHVTKDELDSAVYICVVNKTQDNLEMSFPVAYDFLEYTHDEDGNEVEEDDIYEVQTSVFLPKNDWVKLSCLRIETSDHWSAWLSCFKEGDIFLEKVEDE